MLLLTLKAGTNRYAIDVRRVVELVPNVQLTTIPHSPPFLAGLLGYRGKIIPVIDLGALLCSASCRDCLSTRIILVSDAPGDQKPEMDASTIASNALSRSTSDLSSGATLGLVGEQVSDLTYVQPEQVVPTPVPLSHAAFLDGIVQTEQGIIQLIAVDRIREAALGGYILDQGTIENADPLNAVAVIPAREDSEAET